MASNTLNLARTVAPAALVYNIAMQLYGVVLRNPSIIDVHDDNLSFFSPEPLFIGVAFSSVMVLQAVWMWKIVRANPHASNDRTTDNAAVPYIAVNVLSNVCIGTWVLFWTSSQLKIADLLVLISTAAHLAYMFLSPVFTATKATGSPPTTSLDSLTRAVIAGFTALGVLDLLHNSSIAFAKDAAPGFLVEILTGVGFVALSAAGDALFGAGLVFDLLALCFGQARYSTHGWGWSVLLGVYAVGCGAIVAGKQWVWPRYASSRKGRYGTVGPEEHDEIEDDQV